MRADAARIITFFRGESSVIVELMKKETGKKKTDDEAEPKKPNAQSTYLLYQPAFALSLFQKENKNKNEVVREKCLKHDRSHSRCVSAKLVAGNRGCLAVISLDPSFDGGRRRRRRRKRRRRKRKRGNCVIRVSIFVGGNDCGSSFHYQQQTIYCCTNPFFFFFFKKNHASNEKTNGEMRVHVCRHTNA